MCWTNPMNSMTRVSMPFLRHPDTISITVTVVDV